ncbi:hypothetical protein T484DRAFT_1849821 [Baffinella frigidus]|nr:hypothetical protein T484DRAFT_1849821 [Cryptophyta sp. CCMP2293]
MLVDGVHYRTIFLHEQDASVVRIIDQRKLPHLFEIEDLRTWEEMAVAIKDMHVRGAGLVGASAGFGMYLAALAAPRESEAAFKSFVEAAGEALKATRPTAGEQLATMEAAGPDLAVNLECMVTRQLATMEAAGPDLAGKVAAAKAGAIAIADEDAEFCRRLREHGKKLIAEISEKKGGLVPDLRLGEHGKKLISEISEKKGGAVVNVLTHCNAGWLAFVDVGSATAPIYAAHDAGIKVHVFVDETRNP